MEQSRSVYARVVQYTILFVSLLAIALHVGNFTVFTLPSIQFYAWHIMIGLVLVYLYFPLDRKHPEGSKVYHACCHILDWIVIALVVGISAWVILNFEAYSQDMQNGIVTDQIFWFGIVLSLIVLEAARRVLGIVLPIIAILAVLYALLGAYIPGLFGNRGYSLRRVALALFSDRGIYGMPTGTCANNVYLFLMFAAYLNASGADVIFQNLAIALAGNSVAVPPRCRWSPALFSAPSAAAVSPTSYRREALRFH